MPSSLFHHITLQTFFTCGFTGYTWDATWATSRIGVRTVAKAAAKKTAKGVIRKWAGQEGQGPAQASRSSSRGGSGNGSDSRGGSGSSTPSGAGGGRSGSPVEGFAAGGKQAPGRPGVTVSRQEP